MGCATLIAGTASILTIVRAPQSSGLGAYPHLALLCLPQVTVPSSSRLQLLLAPFCWLPFLRLPPNNIHTFGTRQRATARPAMEALLRSNQDHAGPGLFAR